VRLQRRVAVGVLANQDRQHRKRHADADHVEENGNENEPLARTRGRGTTQ
jgi:hypothetical protein